MEHLKNIKQKRRFTAKGACFNIQFDSAPLLAACKSIPLTQGKFAIVDAEDYEWLNQWKWFVVKLGNSYYAARQKTIRPKKQKMIFMHRQLLNAQAEDEIDHRNNYGLDNRKNNVRFCTRTQNQQNQRPRKNATSKFKGVSWKKARNKWYANIRYKSKNIYLGCFDSEIKAARMYDKKAKKLFGEFALTNL